MVRKNDPREQKKEAKKLLKKGQNDVIKELKTSVKKVERALTNSKAAPAKKAKAPPTRKNLRAIEAPPRAKTEAERRQDPRVQERLRKRREMEAEDLEKFQDAQQREARKQAGIEKRRATMAAKKAAKKK